MLIGIGTDIIEINRFKNSINNQNFLDRIYTNEEQSQITHINSLAGHFAAKEAVSKALGTGFRGFSPKDIEILHDSLGKPYVKLYSGALTRFNLINAVNINVSISHNKSNVIAFVTIED